MEGRDGAVQSKGRPRRASLASDSAPGAQRQRLASLQAQYGVEQTGYHAVLDRCKAQLKEVLETTRHLPIPNVERTRVCAELLYQLSESLVRLSPVLRPLTQQVLSSVFRPSPTKGEPPVPYFHLVATVRDKMNALQQEMSVAEARRRKMETDEFRRTFVLDAAARHWKTSLTVNVFNIWRNNVNILKRQRATIATVLNRWRTNPMLLSNAFMAWKLDHVSRKREKMEAALDEAYQRHVTIEQETTEARANAETDLRELGNMRQNVEVLKAQRVEIEESIAQMEHKLFQSKDRDINFTIKTLMDLTKIGLNSLEAELAMYSSKPMEDVRRIIPNELSLDNSSEQELLLAWVNFHLCHLQRRPPVENFTTDLSNGVVLALILHKTRPGIIAHIDKLIDPTLGSHERCTRLETILLGADDLLPVDMQQMLRANNLAYGMSPDLTVAFLARLFVEFPTLQRTEPSALQLAARDAVQHSYAAIDEVCNALDSTTDDQEQIDYRPLESLVISLTNAYTAVSEYEKEVETIRGIWQRVQSRIRRYILDVLIHRVEEIPIDTIDLRQRRHRQQWAEVDEDMIRAEMSLPATSPGGDTDQEADAKTVATRANLIEVLRVRNVLSRNYAELQSVFLGYATSDVMSREPSQANEDNATLSFLEFWYVCRSLSGGKQLNPPLQDADQGFEVAVTGADAGEAAGAVRRGRTRWKRPAEDGDHRPTIRAPAGEDRQTAPVRQAGAGLASSERYREFHCRIREASTGDRGTGVAPPANVTPVHQTDHGHVPEVQQQQTGGEGGNGQVRQGRPARHAIVVHVDRRRQPVLLRREAARARLHHRGHPAHGRTHHRPARRQRPPHVPPRVHRPADRPGLHAVPEPVRGHPPARPPVPVPRPPTRQEVK